jgi:hypothetical protein
MKKISLVFLMPIFKIKLSLTRNMSQHLRAYMGDTFAHDLHIFLVHRYTVASSSCIPSCTCTAKNWETAESCLQTPGEAHNCVAVNASLQDANMKACCDLIQRDQHWLMTESSLGCWCTWGAETPFPASKMKVPWRSSDMRQWQKLHVYVTMLIPCLIFRARLLPQSRCARNRLHVPAALALRTEMQGDNSLFHLLHFLAALRSLNLSKALKPTTGKTRTCPSSRTPLCFWKARLRTLSTPISSSALSSLLSSGAQWDPVLRRTQQQSNKHNPNPPPPARKPSPNALWALICRLACRPWIPFVWFRGCDILMSRFLCNRCCFSPLELVMEKCLHQSGRYECSARGGNPLFNSSLVQGIGERGRQGSYYGYGRRLYTTMPENSCNLLSGLPLFRDRNPSKQRNNRWEVMAVVLSLTSLWCK